MVHPTIDPVTIKQQQRATWDAVSVGWEASTELFERYARAVTRHLLSAAGVAQGQSVLDIATGLGEPALSAARLVWPGGRVLGIDISPAMVEAARRRAAGVPGVTYEVADLEESGLPPGSFDVALSRWGLMFAVDHVAAFRSVARLLVPGGVLAASVWGPPPVAPIIAFSFAAVAGRLELPPPPPGTPGPFSMADPARLAAELTAAGFVEVTVEELTLPFHFASTGEYVAFSRSITPPGLLAAIRERTGDDNDPATWDAVGVAARERFADGDGLLMPSTALCLRATSPR